MAVPLDILDSNLETKMGKGRDLEMKDKPRKKLGHIVAVHFFFFLIFPDDHIIYSLDSEPKVLLKQ